MGHGATRTRAAVSRPGAHPTPRRAPDGKRQTIRVAVPAETRLRGSTGARTSGRSELEATERRRYEAQGASRTSRGRPGGDRY